ncbi:MAG TPA: ABC transporter substrate-binding protein, partial [Sporichthya sp.]|nr:ABC transporter substrate-binding protein [Sporichthya sp.]
MPLVLASCGTRLDDDELGLGDGASSTVVQAAGSATVPDAATGSTAQTGPSTVTDPSGTGATTAPQVPGPAAAGNTGPAAAASTGPKPSGAGAGAGDGAAAIGGLGPCTKVLDPILLGQNGTFSGFLQGSLGGFRPGMAAWAADVNARGGIQCHPVKLFQVDDGSNPAKTVSNTKDLIENKHVIAMVGAVVPFNITSYRSV